MAATHEYILVDTDGSHCVLITEAGPITLEACQKAVEGLILSYNPEIEDGIAAYINEGASRAKVTPNKAFPGVRGRVLIGRRQADGDFCGLTGAQRNQVVEELRRRIQDDP